MTTMMNDFMNTQRELHRYFHSKIGKGQAFGPHRGQGRVLALLKLNPEISQKELTFVLGMRPQSVGELLKKMEDKEWITRTPSEEDGRVMIIHLTELGQAEAEKVGERPQFDDELFADFSEEEKAEFSRLLNKLNDAIKDQIGDAPEQDNFAGFGGGRGGFGGHPGFGPGCGGGHGHGHGGPHDGMRHFHDFDFGE